ncbi:uncharacterized protein LOC122614050 isoform X1 [Drosophila teissieri]|uniref:uncharacterized protein LOC122614050 isoform X1 n=1 Tax=Drosophila teissieri TaxID=7243 RepID=UPI001CB9E257|nr:uncharacterized protein LOC122614050 isoform X1 [Drosophila teissieri]
MKPKDLDFSQEEKSSDSSNESLHPTSSGFRPRSTLSSPFYQGATTFGGNADIIRNSQHLNFTRMISSAVNKTGETATYSESTESKRRRVYAFLNQKEIMYRKYRKMVNNSEKELEKSQWSFEKPVMRTFFFSEPIPLKPVNSRRNFVFSEPTPLE